MNYITSNKNSTERHSVADLPPLADVFLEHLPTKQGHNYLPLFERHFDPVRSQVKKVLEIGVEAGTSLRMWKDYFPNAEIIGFDIDPACQAHEEERIKIIIGDQRNTDDLNKIPGGLDIVIDDGLHTCKSQIVSFEYLIKNKMSERGIYAVEDIVGDQKVFEYFNRLAILLNYWPDDVPGSYWSKMDDFTPYLEGKLPAQNDIPTYKNEKKRRKKFLKALFKKGGDNNKKSGRYKMGRNIIQSKQDIYFIQNVLGVSTYRHIIFVDKGKNPQDGQAAFRLLKKDLWGKVGAVRADFLQNSDFKLDK